MKKNILIVLVLVFQIGFAKDKLTENQKLATTCKIWGFLKYYHPQVASGKMDWDKQLFELLPQIEKAQTKEEFSLVLEKWIDVLGEVPANKPLALAPDTDFFTKNLDLEWTKKNKLFSKKLSQKLQFISEYRFQGKNHYVNLDGASVPLQFTNEVAYAEFPWTDKNLRLLALFRYWNYVEYFFPYKYVMDLNWDEALVEMLPRFSSPESEKDFVLAMREISIRLNDTHASTQTIKLFDYFGDKFIPAVVKIIDEKAVITSLHNDSLAKISDVKVGDVITKVQGKAIGKL